MQIIKFSNDVTWSERDYRASIEAHRNAVYQLQVFDTLHKSIASVPDGMTVIEYKANIAVRRQNLINDIIDTMLDMRKKEKDFTDMVKSELKSLI